MAKYRSENMLLFPEIIEENRIHPNSCEQYVILGLIARFIDKGSHQE